MHPVHKFVRRRPNLSISIVVGVFAGLLLPSVWNPITRALYAWNIAVWLYLVLMAFLLMGVSHARVREMAEQEDESAVAILAILSVAAIASLAAIAIELSALKDLPFTFRVAKYAFTGSTIIGSWFLIAVLYTVHYAHLFYRSPPGHRALQFPDKEQRAIHLTQVTATGSGIACRICRTAPSRRIFRGLWPNSKDVLLPRRVAAFT